MILRPPSQPVWPERPRRVLFIFNLNPSLVGGAFLLVVSAMAFLFAAGTFARSKLRSADARADASAVKPSLPSSLAAAPTAVQTQGKGLLYQGPSLKYVDNSTSRIEQLIGDTDYETKQPTLNQTDSRYGIEGTDLGYSFEHNGKLYFLFGDTMGTFGGDVLAVSDSTSPSGPLRFDMLTDANGNYLTVDPPTVEMGAFETPVSGLSLNGNMYVVVKTSYFPPHDDTVAAILTRYDPSTQSFQLVRWISDLPGGHFITPNMRVYKGAIPGLGDGNWVLLFGSGDYRNSPGYLAAVSADNFETGNGTAYFTGLDSNGQPLWSTKEGDAKPIIDQPDLGDVSVSYIDKIGLWVALSDSLAPRGILGRYSPTPWGPWSAPQVLFEPTRDHGYGNFIHDPDLAQDDGLDGPIIDPDSSPYTLYGGFYAPYLIDRFTQVNGDQVTLQYTMSTWNPYVVVRMRSVLNVVRPAVAPLAKQTSGIMSGDVASHGGW